MKQIQIKKRDAIYYITWDKSEIGFQTETQALAVMDSIIELLKRNAGLAKLNERKRIYAILNGSPYPGAVSHIEGALHG